MLHRMPSIILTRVEFYGILLPGVSRSVTVPLLATLVAEAALPAACLWIFECHPCNAKPGISWLVDAGISYFVLSKDCQMSSIASSADMQLGNLGVFLSYFCGCRVAWTRCLTHLVVCFSEWGWQLCSCIASTPSKMVLYVIALCHAQDFGDSDVYWLLGRTSMKVQISPKFMKELWILRGLEVHQLWVPLFLKKHFRRSLEASIVLVGQECSIFQTTKLKKNLYEMYHFLILSYGNKNQIWHASTSEVSRNWRASSHLDFDSPGCFGQEISRPAPWLLLSSFINLQ